jgi:thiol-disulfide isomerase/thioredoxin
MSKMHDLEQLRRKSEPVGEYLSSSAVSVPAFAESAEGYRLDPVVVEGLRSHAGSALVLVFSAEWCQDCRRVLPVAGVISEATGLKVRVFGHLMRDPKRPRGHWRIPPSPEEVEAFQIRRIPTIVVLDRDGRVMGEIVESPPTGRSLEAALLDILSGA